jgi:hypothetical protein
MSKVLICPAIYPAVQGSPLNAANAANILAGDPLKHRANGLLLLFFRLDK